MSGSSASDKWFAATRETLRFRRTTQPAGEGSNEPVAHGFAHVRG